MRKQLTCRNVEKPKSRRAEEPENRRAEEHQVLHDTYDPDFFRMGICKEAIAFEPKRDKGATMKLVFHCQPQRWSVDGQRKLVLMKETTLRKFRFSHLLRNEWDIDILDFLYILLVYTL